MTDDIAILSQRNRWLLGEFSWEICDLAESLKKVKGSFTKGVNKVPNYIHLNNRINADPQETMAKLKEYAELPENEAFPNLKLIRNIANIVETKRQARTLIIKLFSPSSNLDEFVGCMLFLARREQFLDM